MKEYLEFIMPSLTAIIAFFSGREIQKANTKKAVEDAKNSELQNLSTVREAEKQLIGDMRTHLQELAEINNELKNIIAQKDAVIKEYKQVIEQQKKNLEKCKVQCGLK